MGDEALTPLTERSKTKKKPSTIRLGAFLLSIQDSNLDWLIQSQMCYHYTNGQSLCFVRRNDHFTSQKRVQKYYFFPN